MMECDRMKELIDAYVDRQLPHELAAQVKRHLTECNHCRRAAEGLTRLRNGVKIAAGEEETPAHLMERVRILLSRSRRRTLAARAFAITLILATSLLMFLTSGRVAATTALDYLVLKLDDSRQVVLEGKLLCRDCQLQMEYGYHAMCALTGHHAAIVTDEGRIWTILEGEKFPELNHPSALRGHRIRVEGRLYRKAGSLAVGRYQLL